MLNEMQELISRLRDLWEKVSDEYYYGHINDKVRRYVEDISGLAQHCYEIDVTEWNDYSGGEDNSLDDIAGALANWIEEGFKFNIVGYYDDEDGDGCTVDFYITIPHNIYWKGPGAWVPFAIGNLWELENEEIEVEARHVSCPMEVAGCI